MPLHPFPGRGSSLVAASMMLLSFTLCTAPAMAKHPHQDPPGWSRGEKRGWQGHDEPPGWRKHHRDREDSYWQRQGGEGSYRGGYRRSSHRYRNSSYGRSSFYGRGYRSAPQPPDITIQPGAASSGASDLLNNLLQQFTH